LLSPVEVDARGTNHKTDYPFRYTLERMAQTALVTGAGGFTGTHMVSHLTQRGWEVVGTDLETERREAFYTETDNAPHPVYDTSLVEERGADFIAADLTDRDALGSLFEEHDYDVVFHTASLFDYFAEEETLRAVNVDGARNIATAAAEAGVDHFVHFSTLGVLGEAGFDEPKDEDAPYNPHNRYCESKVEQEQTLESLATEHGLPLTIVRPAPIYGPGNRYGVFHIPLVVAKLGFAPVFRIYPRSKQLVFPSIHVEDLCRLAIFVSRNRERARGEVYNAVSDCIKQDELLSFLAEAIGVPTVRIPTPYPIYKALSLYATVHSRRIEEIARSRDKRPKIDAPITKYLSHNMWFSNRKIRDLGFEFTYRDPRHGLWDFVTWCKERGLLP
jgi:nucleoside-diphosphate-sugar epimerase